jgi:microcystin degradation protein MlrC
MNILIAGFQHETNTFAPSPADWPAFCAATAFRPTARAPTCCSALPTAACPSAASSRRPGPGLAAAAGLLGRRHALGRGQRRGLRAHCRRIVGAAEEALAGPGLQAIYLDLHGAAVTASHEDAEGELLRRLRARVGPGCPSWPAWTCTPT